MGRDFLDPTSWHAFDQLTFRQRTLLSLEATRRLVSLLYHQELYVDAKLVEVPTEIGLQFFHQPTPVFNRLYGCVDPLIFRCQEESLDSDVSGCLESAFHATLACCSLVHPFEQELTGGPGPTADCYLAEVGDDDPEKAIRLSLEAEHSFRVQRIAEIHGIEGPPQIGPWLPAAIRSLNTKPEADWVRAQPRLNIPYPVQSS